MHIARWRMVLSFAALLCFASAYALGTDPGKTEAPATLAVEASRISIHVRDMALQDVLQSFADQSRNKLLTAPKELADRPVTLNIDDLPYWEALTKMCEAAGITWRAVFGVQFADAPGARIIIAPAGPAVVKLDSVTVTRNFRDPQVQPQINLMVQYTWEDRLKVMASHICFTSAATADGRALNLGNAGAFLSAWPQSRFSPYVGTTAVMFTSGHPEKMESIGRVEGLLRLEFAEGRRELRIEKALAAGERSATADGFTIKVVKSERTDQNVTFNLQVTRDGQDASLPTPLVHVTYGFKLLGPDGKLYEANQQGAAPQIHAEGAGANVHSVVAAPPVGGPDGNYMVGFPNIPDLAGAWTLVYVFPRAQVSRDYPFSFTNVPLR